MQQSQQLTVCMAGATGWTGRALVRGVLDAPDLSLRSAVSRSAAGRDLGGTPAPYVAGTLIAVRRAPGLVGLTRGLDALLLAQS